MSKHIQSGWKSANMEKTSGKSYVDVHELSWSLGTDSVPNSEGHEIQTSDHVVKYYNDYKWLKQLCHHSA